MQPLPAELVYTILTIAKPLERVRAFMAHHVERAPIPTDGPCPEVPLEDLFDKWRAWPPHDPMPEVQFRGLVALAGYEIHVLDEPAVCVGVRWRAEQLVEPPPKPACRRPSRVVVDDAFLGSVRRAARNADTFRDVARNIGISKSTFASLRKRHDTIGAELLKAWGGEKYATVLATAERRARQ